jgi:hypothetical protein
LRRWLRTRDECFLGVRAAMIERSYAFWLGAHFPKQGSNPLAGRGLMHRFALPVLVGHPCAAFQQQPDDAGLLFTRLRRTAPSSPGSLNGKV